MGTIDFDKVTTRGGDRGESSLYDGERRRKDDAIFECLGDIDELTSHLGLARVALDKEHFDTYALRMMGVQADLINLMGMIATPRRAELYGQLTHIGKGDVDAIEHFEKELMDSTPLADGFVLPGDGEASARLDVARAVCRRAERRLVACIRDQGLAHLAVCQNYLNRLSDLLFVLARAAAES